MTNLFLNGIAEFYDAEKEFKDLFINYKKDFAILSNDYGLENENIYFLEAKRELEDLENIDLPLVPGDWVIEDYYINQLALHYNINFIDFLKLYKLAEDFNSNYHYCDNKILAEAVYILFNIKFEFTTFRGLSQGDYCDIAYNPEKISDHLLSVAEDYFFGDVYEYCITEDDDEDYTNFGLIPDSDLYYLNTLEDYCDYVGEKLDNVYLSKDYTQVPNYEKLEA